MDDLKEVRDRCRRIETRLTKYMMRNGFDAETQTPIWHRAGIVEVPSRATSLMEVIAAIPGNWPRGASISVMHKGETLCRVLPEPAPL